MQVSSFTVVSLSPNHVYSMAPRPPLKELLRESDVQRAVDQVIREWINGKEFNTIDIPSVG